MTLERARSHDGWRARRPRPLAAIASRAIKKFRVSATLRMTDAPPPRGLGSRNSHFYRPNAEVLTGAASAIAVGKRRRSTSRSQSGGPQPTGDCERDRPLVSPLSSSRGRRWHPLCARKVHRDQCRHESRIARQARLTRSRLAASSALPIMGPATRGSAQQHRASGPEQT
jgi:hypothetical protein